MLAAIETKYFETEQIGISLTSEVQCLRAGHLVQPHKTVFQNGGPGVVRHKVTEGSLPLPGKAVFTVSPGRALIKKKKKERKKEKKQRKKEQEKEDTEAEENCC